MESYQRIGNDRDENEEFLSNAFPITDSIILSTSNTAATTTTFPMFHLLHDYVI